MPGTVAALVVERARTSPDLGFITFDDGTMTYAALAERGARLAGALRDFGIAPGERVATMLRTEPAAIEAWVATGWVGVVEVPLHPSLRGDSLVHQLRASDARLLVISPEFADTVAEAVGHLPSPPRVLVVGPDYEEALASATPVDAPEDVPATDLAVIMFSSGTTGAPKGIQLSHSANFALATTVASLMRYTPDDVLYSVFPLSHVNARYTTVLAAMIAGSRCVLHSRFSASRFWDLCRAHGITAFNYMGVVPAVLLKQPSTAADRDHSVTKAYGSGSLPDSARDFGARFGVTLVETYGSTELGSVTHATLDDTRRGSCGLTDANYEIAIHDEAGRPVATGESGEIVVRPRQPGVMFSGYLDNPGAMVDASRDLWFHTGDRGHVDRDGWYFFDERLKDSIRRRGENVSAWEVEEALDAHPGVAECAVVGVPSDLGDEEVLAVIVTKDALLAPEALYEHCVSRLPGYAVPRYFRFESELPRNASQRIEKRILKQQGLGDSFWDREQHGLVPPR